MTVDHVSHPRDEEENFCNGAGTDMFMQGFQVIIISEVSVMNVVFVYSQVATARMFV